MNAFTLGGELGFTEDEVRNALWIFRTDGQHYVEVDHIRIGRVRLTTELQLAGQVLRIHADPVWRMFFASFYSEHFRTRVYTTLAEVLKGSRVNRSSLAPGGVKVGRLGTKKRRPYSCLPVECVTAIEAWCSCRCAKLWAAESTSSQVHHSKCNRTTDGFVAFPPAQIRAIDIIAFVHVQHEVPFGHRSDGIVFIPLKQSVTRCPRPLGPIVKTIAQQP